MLTYNLEQIAFNVVLPHVDCPDQHVHRVQGAYDVILDSIQIDELHTNGYTVATETCLLCYQTSTLLLKAPKPNQATPSPEYLI
jgi:hypothetical protein